MATQQQLEPNREFAIELEDGATVIVSAYGAGPRIVISHGNGFAVEAYRAFWSRLAEEHEVVVFSQRHHGRNSPFRVPLRNIPQFVNDFDRVLAAIAERLGAKSTFGAFHSLSAIVALIHASTRPSQWRGLVVFEPPIPPPEGTDLSRRLLQFNESLWQNASRRREWFEAPSDLAASFARREAFSRMSPEALKDLANATLRARPSGGYELSCARQFEAETFKLKDIAGAWENVVRLKLPLCIVGSDPVDNPGACLVDIAHHLAKEGAFSYRSVANTTHLMQLEAPDACAEVVSSFISSSESSRRKTNT